MLMLRSREEELAGEQQEGGSLSPSSILLLIHPIINMQSSIPLLLHIIIRMESSITTSIILHINNMDTMQERIAYRTIL